MQMSDIVDRLLTEALAAPAGDVTLAEACAIAQRAETRASAMQVPVCISVANSRGEQILFHRMKDALPASATLASDKAWSASAFRMTTAALGRLAEPGGMLAGIGNKGRVVLFGGGLPLMRRGRVCGAVGISGGSVDEDIEIARQALGDAFDKTGQDPETE